MQYFANDPNADAINRVRGGVAEVKNIMVENIEKVMLLPLAIVHTVAHLLLTASSEASSVS